MPFNWVEWLEFSPAEGGHFEIQEQSLLPVKTICPKAEMSYQVEFSCVAARLGRSMWQR